MEKKIKKINLMKNEMINLYLCKYNIGSLKRARHENKRVIK